MRIGGLSEQHAHRPAVRKGIMNMQKPGSAVAMLGLICLAATLGGCSAEAGTYLGSREVIAQATTLNGTSVCRRGDAARLVVALTAFDVTEREITWGDDQVLALPDEWKKLELVQAKRSVIVRVDGREFHRIAV